MYLLHSVLNHGNLYEEIEEEEKEGAGEQMKGKVN
jgi:hypothetical protein